MFSFTWAVDIGLSVRWSAHFRRRSGWRFFKREIAIGIFWRIFRTGLTQQQYNNNKNLMEREINVKPLVVVQTWREDLSKIIPLYARKLSL